jgi:phosphopantetheine adenylyltransferase
VASGYIWRYAMANNAKIFFRGIRSWEQDGKDERALHLTNLWGPLVCGPLKWPLPTHYLEGDPKYTSLSSTFVRDRCKEIKENKESTSGKALADLSLFVPQEVVDDIVRAYSK